MAAPPMVGDWVTSGGVAPKPLPVMTTLGPEVSPIVELFWAMICETPVITGVLPAAAAA